MIVTELMRGEVHLITPNPNQPSTYTNTILLSGFSDRLLGIFPFPSPFFPSAFGVRHLRFLPCVSRLFCSLYTQAWLWIR
jgi:hypothetical protein